MLPVAGGKSGLKPQGTVTHQKQWRADQKKYCLSYCNDKIILIKIPLKDLDLDRFVEVFAAVPLN